GAGGAGLDRAGLAAPAGLAAAAPAGLGVAVGVAGVVWGDKGRAVPAPVAQAPADRVNLPRADNVAPAALLAPAGWGGLPAPVRSCRPFSRNGRNLPPPRRSHLSTAPKKY